MDALVYASIKNNLTSDKELEELRNTNVFKVPPKIWTNNRTKDLKALDDLLDKTTIKRSVCLNNPTVSVRIPIPTGSDPYKEQKKFGYIDKDVKVPENLRAAVKAEGYAPNNDMCNKFFHLYCKNTLKNYTDANKGYSRGEWPRVKPECACYGQVPSWLGKQTGTLPGTCWAPQCIPGAGAYMDLASQGNPNCNVQVCNQNIDLSDFKADEIDANVQAKCNQSGASGQDNPFDDGSKTTGGQTTGGQTTGGQTTGGQTTGGQTTGGQTTGGQTTGGQTTGGQTTGGKTTGGQTTGKTSTTESSSNPMFGAAAIGVPSSILSCCCIIVIIIAIYLLNK